MLLKVLLIVACHSALNGRLKYRTLRAVVAVGIVIVITVTTSARKVLVVWLNREHILDYGETHRSCFWKRS